MSSQPLAPELLSRRTAISFVALAGALALGGCATNGAYEARRRERLLEIYNAAAALVDVDWQYMSD